MPELPEVETIRRDLQRVLKGKKITRVQVRKAKLVRGSARAFERELKNQRIELIKRRGKLLIVKLGGGKRHLLIHLKMTGQLIYRDNKREVAGGHGYPLVEKLPNKYSHVIFYFSGGGVPFSSRKKSDSVIAGSDTILKRSPMFSIITRIK